MDQVMAILFYLLTIIMPGKAQGDWLNDWLSHVTDHQTRVYLEYIGQAIAWLITH